MLSNSSLICFSLIASLHVILSKFYQSVVSESWQQFHQCLLYTRGRHFCTQCSQRARPNLKASLCKMQCKDFFTIQEFSTLGKESILFYPKSKNNSVSIQLTNRRKGFTSDPHKLRQDRKIRQLTNQVATPETPGETQGIKYPPPLDYSSP